MSRTVNSIAVCVVALFACKSKASNDKTGTGSVTIDRSTPADVGRSLCALLVSGKMDQLGEIAPWPQQVDECNSANRNSECVRGGWRVGTPCTVVPADKTYPDCNEQTLRRHWNDFAETFAKTHATCSVERPESGRLEEIDMLIFGTRETVVLEKQTDGRWQVGRKRFFLPDIQRTALDEQAKHAQDQESGFEKK